MRHIYILFLFINIGFLKAQDEMIVVPTLQNSVASETGDLLVIATLSSIPVASETDSILISSSPIPLLLLGQTTSIHGLEKMEGLTVYPNPFSFSMTLQREQDVDHLQVCIFNPGGNTIQESAWQPGQNSMEVNLSDLPSGMYTIQVRNDSNTKGNQFMVVKR